MEITELLNPVPEKIYRVSVAELINVSCRGTYNRTFRSIDGSSVRIRVHGFSNPELITSITGWYGTERLRPNKITVDGVTFKLDTEHERSFSIVERSDLGTILTVVLFWKKSYRIDDYEVIERGDDITILKNTTPNTNFKIKFERRALLFEEEKRMSYNFEGKLPDWIGRRKLEENIILVLDGDVRGDVFVLAQQILQQLNERYEYDWKSTPWWTDDYARGQFIVEDTYLAMQNLITNKRSRLGR